MPKKLHQKCTKPRFYALLRVFFKSQAVKTINKGEYSKAFIEMHGCRKERKACKERIEGLFIRSESQLSHPHHSGRHRHQGRKGEEDKVHDGLGRAEVNGARSEVIAMALKIRFMSIFVNLVFFHTFAK